MLNITLRVVALTVCLVAATAQSAWAQQKCVAWGLDKPNQLHCFWIGDEAGQLWHKGWWDGAWRTWQNLGKPNGVSFPNYAEPDCLAWGPTKPDQLHCFVFGNDFHLWHIGWANGSWHDWQDLGGPTPLAGSTPSCVAWGPLKPDQIHCFVRGGNGAMWHRGWWGGSWQPWQDMGRPPGKTVDSAGPRCLAWGLETLNQLHCFTLATDEDDVYPLEEWSLWHLGWWDGAWHSWQSLGKPANTKLRAQPECIAWGLDKPNQLHCFLKVEDSGQRLWHRWWADGSWSGWQDLGGPADLDRTFYSYHRPSCVAWGLEKPNQLRCFVSFDGTLWHRGFWDGSWHPWQNLGGPNWQNVTKGVGHIGCLAWGLEKADQLHCFTVAAYGGGYAGSLWHIGMWNKIWHAWQYLGHP